MSFHMIFQIQKSTNESKGREDHTHHGACVEDDCNDLVFREASSLALRLSLVGLEKLGVARNPSALPVVFLLEAQIALRHDAPFVCRAGDHAIIRRRKLGLAPVLLLHGLHELEAGKPCTHTSHLSE